MGNIHTPRPLKDLPLEQLEEVIRGVIISDPWNSLDDSDEVKYTTTVEFMKTLGCRPVTALEYSRELHRAACTGQSPKIMVWRPIDANSEHKRRDSDKVMMSREDTQEPSKRLCVEIRPTTNQTSDIIVSGQSQIRQSEYKMDQGKMGRSFSPDHMDTCSATTSAPTEAWIRK